MSDAIWIRGASQSGKTTRLINYCCQWLRAASSPYVGPQAAGAFGLVIVINPENRQEFADQIALGTDHPCPLKIITPLHFLRTEVLLFWPLLIQSLPISPQFPLRLRPETEQELATQLWRHHFADQIFPQSGLNLDRMVRQTLDIFQLAALSGTPIEKIPEILEAGVSTWEAGTSLSQQIGEFLLHWKSWCWQQGFLTHGMIAELYHHYLFPDPTYQTYLQKQYGGIFADDVDEYPAILRPVLELFLNQQKPAFFTYNPDGGVRLGLDADPKYLAELEQHCQIETLPTPFPPSLATEVAGTFINLVREPQLAAWLETELPPSIQTLHTPSRAQLLRATTNLIIQAIEANEISPEDIAIIAPGLDPIARYTLIEIFADYGITVESLNEQRPLASSPIVRALLTLLTLIYPGNGRLADRDAIAEMLVVLSQDPFAIISPESEEIPLLTPAFPSFIDPVRAGLIVDHCFVPDPTFPRLLNVQAFPRWDRLGYLATTAYQNILTWLAPYTTHPEHQIDPVTVLDLAIQKFLWNGQNLVPEQFAVLRELITIAQHYWQVQDRLHLTHPPSGTSYSTTVGQFVQLLRRGTITANPFPHQSWEGKKGAITLGTIFQYRFSRRAHRWHFWLDAGSPLWLRTGDAVRFGATLFLKHWSGHPFTPEDSIEVDQQRLCRILLDLLSRVRERLYLCHSELAVNGQEQLGPLLPLVHRSMLELT